MNINEIKEQPQEQLFTFPEDRDYEARVMFLLGVSVFINIIAGVVLWRVLT